VICKGEIVLDRMRFELYWSYYLSIEKMLSNTSQYVSPSSENKKTYSDEFTKIILLSCSEIDSILKLICKCKGIEYDQRKYNMNIYSEVLLQFKDIKKISYASNSNTSMNENSLSVTPFEKLNSNTKYGGLSWWEDYQSLKHNRLDNAEKGNLFNAVSSISAHYILLRFLIEFLDEYAGKSYVIDHNLSEYLIPCV
jgi:hypothetical protein